jgi:hypothetical protein
MWLVSQSSVYIQLLRIIHLVSHLAVFMSKTCQRRQQKRYNLYIFYSDDHVMISIVKRACVEYIVDTSILNQRKTC